MIHYRHQILLDLVDPVDLEHLILENLECP
jgi:hypothetical protein